MEELHGTNEPPYRLNIKQTAKGEKYFDITVRGTDFKLIEEQYKAMEAFAFSQGCKKEPIL